MLQDACINASYTGTHHVWSVKSVDRISARSDDVICRRQRHHPPSLPRQQPRQLVVVIYL